MTLFTSEFTTWVGLPTHNHYILPFTSAHWLSTQLDFKTISGHWVKIQSINETAVISLVHNDVITFLQIGFFQSIRPAKWPIRFGCVTNKPVDCNETKHDWKITFRVCIYIECVIENGMRRNSRHKRFTKCFVLGYKNGFYQTKDHSLCNNEHWDCKQRKIVKGKQFILLQFVILFRLCWLK